MPNCTTTGHQLTITWVNIIFIFTHCQHYIKFRIQHAVLCSVSQPFFVKTLLGSPCNCRKIPKISPGAYIFQRPVLRGLSMEGNLRFKIDWASLKVGSKFTVFALFYFVFERKVPNTSPRGAYIWRGLFSEFYGISIAPLMNQDKVLGERPFYSLRK